MIKGRLLLQGVLAVAAASAVVLYRDAAGLIVALYALVMLLLQMYLIAAGWLSWRGEPIIEEQRPAKQKDNTVGSGEDRRERLEREEQGVSEAKQDFEAVEDGLESVSSDTRIIGRRVREIEDELD